MPYYQTSASELIFLHTSPSKKIDRFPSPPLTSNSLPPSASLTSAITTTTTSSSSSDQTARTSVADLDDLTQTLDRLDLDKRLQQQRFVLYPSRTRQEREQEDAQLYTIETREKERLGVWKTFRAEVVREVKIFEEITRRRLHEARYWGLETPTVGCFVLCLGPKVSNDRVHCQVLNDMAAALESLYWARVPMELVCTAHGVERKGSLWVRDFKELKKVQDGKV